MNSGRLPGYVEIRKSLDRPLHNPRWRAAVAGCLLLLAGWTAMAATVEYTYDANGRLKGVYAPSGEAARYVYDAAGNITQIQRFDATQLSVVEFTPASGPVGTQVSIYGTGFDPAPANNVVTFNGTPATVSAATRNRLTTTVPAGAVTGPIGVVVGANNAVSTSNFVVSAVSVAPTIASFSPAVGGPGTPVTINGANFDPTVALNTVTFNTTFANAATASPTVLGTTVPAFAASGALKVRTKYGTATSATDFLVPFGTIAATDIVASYRAVVDGSSASYTIPSNGKVAYVLFDGVQAQSIGIGITISGCATVYVERPDNTDLVASTSVCSNSSLDLPALPLTGTYVVAIKSGASSSISGVVTVSTDNIGTLGAQGTISTFSTTRAGQNGRYKFSAASGEKAAFYVSGLSSAVQASRIDVILPNGQILATATSSAASAYIQTLTFPYTGTYALVVSPQGAGFGTWNIQYGQPDLTVTGFTVGAASVLHSGAYSIPITATVKNEGTVGAKTLSWLDELYLSADSSLDTSDVRLGSLASAADVAAGSTYTVNLTGTTASSTSPGTYTLFFKTDGWDSNGTYSSTTDKLIESNESNNVSSASVTLPARPDLVASNISVGVVTVNQNGSYSFPVTFTVTNNGPSTAKLSWWDFAYLSGDAVLDTSDAYLSYVTRGADLTPGASYNVTINATTPTTTAPGTYTIFGKTDGNNAGSYYAITDQVAESDETNNVVSTTVTLPERPDLVATNVSVGAITVNKNGSYVIPVTISVTNSGPATAKATWYDYAYLSTDSTLTTADPYIGYLSRSTNLAPGGAYNATINAGTSTSTAPGDYTLFVKTDGYSSGAFYSPSGVLTESDESNNVASIPITLPTRPDLIASGVTVGTITVNADGSYTVPVTFTVQNTGGSAAKGGWYDYCYLSADGALDTTDASMAYLYHSADLAPGEQYNVSLNCRTATTTAMGIYTLFVKSDGYDAAGKYSATSQVAEGDETNNTAPQSITLPAKP